MNTIYYCLECDANCGPYQHCCVCEDNPQMDGKEHSGFISNVEIESEIQTEEAFYAYDER